MATITPTIERNGDGSVMIVTWPDMANGDDGTPVDMAQWADRSVQVVGTPGAGGNLRIEGSNNEVNYNTLSDLQGDAMDFTAAGIKAVAEVTQKVRPRVTAGDGATELTAVLLMRRTQPLRT